MYIEYNTNNEWTPQEVIGLIAIIHFINVMGPGQYDTNSNILCFDLFFIKLLINKREKIRTTWSHTRDISLTSELVCVFCNVPQ